MTWKEKHECKLVTVLKEVVMAYFKVLFTYLTVKIMPNYDKFAMTVYCLSKFKMGKSRTQV